MPEQEWGERLQSYGISENVREQLLEEMVETALQAAVDLLAAYQTHRRTRLAAGGSN